MYLQFKYNKEVKKLEVWEKSKIFYIPIHI